MRKKTSVYAGICACAILIVQLASAPASDEKSAADLAKESEAYCKSTVMERPTPPNLIIEKVNAACELLQREGSSAFSKFKGEGSEFLFEGTYIWIHTLDDATMLMHPIKYKMEGKKYIGLKDKNGKRFFVTMNRLVKDADSGWVDYVWPKPGTNEFVRKVSYVKGCKSADGTELVLGCGIYNSREEDLAKLKVH